MPLSIALAGGVFIAAWPTAVEGDRLVLKSRSGYQTVSLVDGGRTGLYYDLGERIGELRPAAKLVVLLGMGGGEMLRAARRTLPDAVLVGVEINPLTAAIAKHQFHVGDFGVHVVVEDAARYIDRQPAENTDALLVDIFDDATLPPYFRSTVFFRACRRVLVPHGLLMMNVYPPALAPEVSSAMLQAGFLSVKSELSWENVVLIAER